MWALPVFSHPYLFTGHSPPLPKHIPQTSQRNPCSLTVPSCSQNMKARLKVTQKELKDLQWEHEVLEQRFSKVRAAGGSGRPVSLSKCCPFCRGLGTGTQQRLPGLGLARSFPKL